MKLVTLFRRLHYKDGRVSYRRIQYLTGFNFQAAKE
ncbi:MAG: hypothetical protein ACI92E_000913 [Oceanicoccus sp.]|jgi:hypothetical protein